MRRRVYLINRAFEESLGERFHDEQLDFIFSDASGSRDFLERQIAFRCRTLEGHLQCRCDGLREIKAERVETYLHQGEQGDLLQYDSLFSKQISLSRPSWLELVEAGNVPGIHDVKQLNKPACLLVFQ